VKFSLKALLRLQTHIPVNEAKIMSTVFEVYPSSKEIPSYKDVLTLSNEYLAQVLRRAGIDKEYIIDVSIRNCKTHEIVQFEKTRPAVWTTDDEYAWFSVNELPGGCDAYVYSANDPFTSECWDDEFASNKRAKEVETEMRKCFMLGFYWAFRRSAGQPAVINLSYGLIAAAFTELSNGFVFSDDGAWDYALFPTNANRFLQSYFDPQYPVPEYANWARECIGSIKNG